MKDYSPILQRLFFIIFWVGSTFGFISEELLPFIASGRSMVYLALDALWIVLACFTVRRIVHLIAIAAILVVSYVSTCTLNGLSILFWINGLRDFLGLLLAYPIICYFMGDSERRARFEPEFDKTVLYFLLLQAACIVIQFILYGAGDCVGGSFGNGFSGQVSMCIYIASFYLVHKNLDTNNIWESLRQNSLPILLLFPTFLNETKVSFILIVLYFVLLMPIDRRYLIRAMVVFPTVMLLVWGGTTVYVMSTSNKDEADFTLDYVEKYLTVEDMDAIEGGALWELEQGQNADVPRVAKIMYLAVLHEQEPGHESLGWGVGQFKGGQGIEISDFAYRYDWLLMGSIPYVFHLLIQLGNAGVIFVAVWILGMFLFAPRWSRGRDLNMQMLVMCCVLIIMGYNDSLRNLWMCLFIFMLLAGSWTHMDDVDDDETDDEDADEDVINVSEEAAEAQS